MNIRCLCNALKEFRPIKTNNPVTYQCMICKKIYLEKDINLEGRNIVGIEKTDNPFLSYVRKPTKKD